MRMDNNTILITGGATGIGYALAEAFLEKGNTVIICGRRENRLKEAQRKHPELHIKVCDVAVEHDRRALVSWVSENFRKLNILVNNAGIQRDIDFTKGTEDLLNGPSEIRINIEGPVYLSAHFIPLLREQQEATIINVSSVLAFAPMARVPVYCATKAFLHNFSLSLRVQLKKSGINVFEVLPPRVKTELNAEGRKKMGYADSGIETRDFVNAVMQGLEKDEYEIEYTSTGSVKRASRDELDAMFTSINNRTFKW